MRAKRFASKVKLKQNQQAVNKINFHNTLTNPKKQTLGISFFIAFLFLLFCTKSFSQAQIKVTDAKKNFGFVQRGTLVKNEFEITNTGNAPLIINDAEVSCSCTTVEFPKQPILPNQTVTVNVNFNTTSVYGRQDRVVIIHSNAQNGDAKLRYKGTVSNK